MIMMSGFLPLIIDLHDRKVVIIGGGSVGERKAELFCRYAKTVVVSLEFTEKLLKSEEIERITIDRELDDEEFTDLIRDAFLVIPATDDPSYNKHLADIASQRGILVNRVDDLGCVIIPSVITRGDIVIGISTLAHSPALSRYIRERIEEVITPEYAEMARLQSEMRCFLKDRIPDQKKRQQILRAILEDESVWEYLKTSYRKAYEQAATHHETVL
ncbi:bifunctional precorrin-2 dehydrogenase/sirohydrochlorin ferrochelatase [ANME-2 cluster archaeon]|nr:MAG: bifunctional precorrin-2 dehydrogenase/sirohydrochlorin ferrochelatase [ANME-2 cluster archaeon]